MNEEEKEIESLEDSILKLMEENRKLREEIDLLRRVQILRQTHKHLFH